MSIDVIRSKEMVLLNTPLTTPGCTANFFVNTKLFRNCLDWKGVNLCDGRRWRVVSRSVTAWVILKRETKSLN